MIALRALQHALFSLIMQFLFFPIWWYTGGAKKILFFAITEISSIFQSFHIPVLVKFIFAPMFGFRDPASRAISICVRIVHFALMLVASAFLSIFWIAVLIVWLVLPPFTVYQYWFHFFA